jgi:hypothetical protein
MAGIQAIFSFGRVYFRNIGSIISQSFDRKIFMGINEGRSSRIVKNFNDNILNSQ